LYEAADTVCNDTRWQYVKENDGVLIATSPFNPLNAELNTISHLLALLGAHHIFHISRIRVKEQPQ
jgi:hypothetical protein